MNKCAILKSSHHRHQLAAQNESHRTLIIRNEVKLNIKNLIEFQKRSLSRQVQRSKLSRPNDRLFLGGQAVGRNGVTFWSLSA